MGFDYKPMAMKKSEAAGNILAAIGQDLPAMDAGFGVYTYAPFKKYLPAGTPGTKGLPAAFEQIPVKFNIIDRQTPMGPDLKSLDDSLARLKDRIRVIVVTDGEANIGQSPVEVLNGMYSKYGDRICFHFISFAQTPDEKALVSQMAGVNPCASVTQAHALVQDDARKDFVENIFYDTRQVADKPAPKPEPKPEPRVEIPNIENVQFEFDTSKITPKYAEELKKAAEMLKQHPDKQIIVKGYTCNMGPAQYNMKLSERRAQAVADFLMNQGVEKNRIKTKAYGEEKPRYDNSTKEGRVLNRQVRIELK
jgi:OOP family OmpA-OmpF porin